MATEPENVGKIAPAGVHAVISGFQVAPPPPPRFATFTMNSLSISNTRSRHNDTDVVHIGVTVGANDTVFVTKKLGDLNNGTHAVGLSIEADIPDDDTIVVFSYLVNNSGHGGDDSETKTAQSVLSTIADAIITHKADTAEAVAVGTIVVPVLVSMVAAVAGILALTEAGLLLFANCDGPVAAGAYRFTCSDLIKRTAAGQKIPEITDHPGVDSPDGCGSNSHYSTTCTVTTTPSVQTVLELRGEWAIGGVAGPFVSRTANSLSIDMSSLKRPTATGSVINRSEISVTFPDDKTYTGALQAPNVIKWSNNSSWTTFAAIETVFDLNGQWMIGGVLGPVFTVHGNSISIDMSALNRKTATGTVMGSSAISVNFPDDKTYSGTLQAPGVIRWSNNSTWSKFDTSVIKHLFVLVMENRSFDHLLGFQGITGKDAETGAPTKAEDLIRPAAQSAEQAAQPFNDFNNSRYTVTPDAGDVIFGKHDVLHQFPDVLTQLCGQTEGQAFGPKGNLKGAAYPTVAGPTETGFAADYGTNSDKTNPGEPMRCFAPGALPVLTALAKEFVLCDHWHSALPGPTEPNRMFVHAASSGGWDDSPTNHQYEEIFGAKAAGDASAGISFEHGTIFDALRRAKVPFRIYTGDSFPQVGLLSGISIYSDIDDFANFASDINDPAYDAAYTFIEPRYDTIPQQLGRAFINNSQHPANSVALGEALIKEVYEAVRNSPHWAQSMLIITWDEHGGFFDHVTPTPAARIPTGSAGQDIVGNQFGFGFDRHGFRVPAVVISPWCPQNLIEHRPLEHSFIPATIEQLFGLGPLTNRDAGVVGLQALATLKAPRNVTAQIPNAAAAAEPGGPLPGTPAEPTGVLASTSVAAATSAGPGSAVSASSALNLDDPWLASALAVAVKAHIEATPADAANIRAQAFGLKTVGDLAQYNDAMTPVVQKARVAARVQKVAARKLAASQAVTAHAVAAV